ncbi:MAG: HTH-type transcriptional regulator / antitoxin HipB [Burkholderiales bacterium]
MDLIELGVKIKETRLEKAIQQEELCAHVGISRSTLSRLENGRLPELGIRKIIAVCERLDLELTLQPAHKRPTLRMLSANVDLTRKVRDGVKIDGKRLFTPHDTTASAALPKRVRRAKSTKGNDE